MSKEESIDVEVVSDSPKRLEGSGRGRKASGDGENRCELSGRTLQVTERVGGYSLGFKTAYARQLFLYGEADGKPVLDLKELAERTGTTVLALRRHVGRWENEREEMFKMVYLNKTEAVFGESTDLFKEHKRDIAFLLREKNKAKDEVDQCETVSEELYILMEKISDSQDLEAEDTAKLLKMVGAYLKACQTKPVLTKRFLDLQAAWQKSSGLLAQIEAASVGVKTAAKMDAEKQWKEVNEEQEPGLRVVEPRKDSVFDIS